MDTLDKRIGETWRVLPRDEAYRNGPGAFGSISDGETWRRLAAARFSCPMVGSGWTRMTRPIFVRMCGWIQNGLALGGRRNEPGAESGPTVSRRACPGCPSGAAVRRYRELLEEDGGGLRQIAAVLYHRIEPPAGMALIGPDEVRERQRRGGFVGPVAKDEGLLEAYRYTINRVRIESGLDY